MPVDAKLAVSFRDPVCMGLLTTEDFGNTASVYVETLSKPATFAKVIGGDEYFAVPLNNVVHTSGPSRYGSRLLNGLVADETVQVVWIDANSAHASTFVVAATFFDASWDTLKMEVEMRYWYGDDEFTVWDTITGTITAKAASVSFSMTHSAYYSVHVRVLGTAAAPDNVLLSLTGTLTVTLNVVCRHLVNQSFQDGGFNLRQARTLGNTLLITNATARWSKSGSIYARQREGNEPWYRDVQSAGQFTALNPTIQYDGALEKGLYAIVKPQGENCLDIRPVTKLDYDNTPTPVYSFLPFRNTGSVVTLMIPHIEEATEGSYVYPTQLVLHYVRGIEFTSPSQLFAVGVTNVRRIELPDLLDALGRVDQFHENPLHLADIKKALISAGQWAWKNKSPLIGIAKTIGSLL